MAKNKNYAINMVALGLLTACFGTSFDAFWHLTRGLETFFVLPHLFVYGGVILSFLGAWRGYKFTKEESWRSLLKALAVIPLAGVLDKFWHQIRGVESVGNPGIIWSLPHIILLVASMTSVMLFTFIIHKEKQLRWAPTLGPGLMGLFLVTLVLFLSPFMPTGPYAIMGTPGVGIVSAGVIFILLLSKKLFPGSPSASLSAFVLVLFQAMIYDSNMFTGSLEFLHTPVWLIFLTYLVPALFIDYMYHKSDAIVIGAFAGFFSAVVFYYLGGELIPNNSFIYIDLWFGALCGSVGGVLAGLAHHVIHVRGEEETE
jgi:hypothetical protein